MRNFKLNLFTVLVGTSFLFTVSGCDQISKLTNYFFPKKNSSEVQAPQPVSVRPVATTPTVVAETPKADPGKSAAGVKAEAELPGGVLARVGDWTITIDEFKNQEKAARDLAQQNKLTYDLPSERLLGMMVEQQLLFQEAQRKGLDRDSKISKQLDEARKLILSQSLQTKMVEDIKPTDEAVKKFYDENKALYFMPAEYKITAIVVATEAEANEILAQLTQGANFTELANARSSVKPADKFILENEFPFQKMVDVVKVLDEGKFSTVFSGPNGFYIVKLEQKRGGKEMGFDEVLDNNLKVKDKVKADWSYIEYLKGLQKIQESIPVKTNLELLKGK